MMKNTKQSARSRLHLHGEILRSLSVTELGHAVGGSLSNGGNCGTTICSGTAAGCGGGGTIK